MPYSLSASVTAASPAKWDKYAEVVRAFKICMSSLQFGPSSKPLSFSGFFFAAVTATCRRSLHFCAEPIASGVMRAERSSLSKVPLQLPLERQSFNVLMLMSYSEARGMSWQAAALVIAPPDAPASFVSALMMPRDLSTAAWRAQGHGGRGLG